ncbi:MAG: hypothetical protein IIB57_15245, partial [Planctomycetes bacterium]|nr:hypothetical protein [Planctomycetota bacterium]
MLIILLVGYLGEQALARSTGAYLSRTSVIPMYVRLFPTSLVTSYTIRMAPPPTEAKRREVRDGISELENPPHILFILLVSYRGDLFDPE